MMDAAYRRWVILGCGVLAQGAGCLFIYGLPTLVPQIRSEAGVSLAGAGLVVAAPTAGLLLTLFAWGALADRIGERVVISAGMAIAAVALLLSPLAGAIHGGSLVVWSVLVFIAGAGGASVNAASGRMVLGWFGPQERGMAMGIRQTAQPLGVAAAALLLPPTARAWGLWWALAIPGALCLVTVAVVWVLAQDPVRPQRQTDGSIHAQAASPYHEPMLYRIHAASTCLVLPQFLVSAFSLAYLVSVRHWDAVDAGRIVFAGQLLGAFGRLGAGWWTDLAHSRLRPMRQLAVGSAAVMIACALLDRAHSSAIIPVLIIAAVITVADNGMAYTAVAERAGPFWAGRALGAHNTVQNLVSVFAPGLLGALIGAHGYAAGFLVAALFPIAAIVLTPVGRERPFSEAGPVSTASASPSPSTAATSTTQESAST
jgi:sugar phosphate permease